MSSRSYFYNKHQSRSRSYYGKKKMYGSAYQPGQTTKYQRYGRTMRLDPGYISIPRELPTRQSQLRQLEELRKAGLIPAPVPPPVPVVYNYLADVSMPSYAGDQNKGLAQIIYDRCISKGLNVSNLIGVSFSGKIHHNPSSGNGYTSVISLFNFKETGDRNPTKYAPFIYKIFSTTSIEIIYTIVFMNPEIVYEDESYHLRSKKVRIILQGTKGSGDMSLLYNTTNNQTNIYQQSQGVPLDDPNWVSLGAKYFSWIDTPDPTEEFPYYYIENNMYAFGKVSNSGNLIPKNTNSWDSSSYLSMWTRFTETDTTFQNSTINNGIVLEFAIPQE